MITTKTGDRLDVAWELQLTPRSRLSLSSWLYMKTEWARVPAAHSNRLLPPCRWKGVTNAFWRVHTHPSWRRRRWGTKDNGTRQILPKPRSLYFPSYHHAYFPQSAYYSQFLSCPSVYLGGGLSFFNAILNVHFSSLNLPHFLSSRFLPFLNSSSCLVALPPGETRQDKK